MKTLTETLDKELARKPKWHDSISLNKVLYMTHEAEDISDEEWRKMKILMSHGYRFISIWSSCRCN